MGVAVKVTLVPAQMFACVAAIETAGVTDEVTVATTAVRGVDEQAPFVAEA